jgi:branched-chain amino acid transport system permease protein
MVIEEKLKILEPSQKMRSGLRRPLLIIVLAVFAIIPFLQSDYLNYMGMRIAIMALFALSFNILLGYTGLLSFGHAAFYGVGGYTAGLMLIHLTSELLLAIVAGAVLAGLTALMVGYFCVKRTRIYFSMLTLAFGMLIYVVCYKWKSLTGGTESLGGIPRGKVFGLIDMFPLSRYYFFVLTITVLGIYLIYRITKSPFGLLIQGIRDNENRIRFAGVMVKRYRLYVFTIAGFFSGLAGGLYACLESTMFPTVCDWQSSAEPIMVTLVGGVESFLGPIVGSVVFILLKEIIVRFTQEWLLVFGVILLVILMGFRGGIAKFIERAFIPWERSSGE